MTKFSSCWRGDEEYLETLLQNGAQEYDLRLRDFRVNCSKRSSGGLEAYAVPNTGINFTDDDKLLIFSVIKAELRV
jgi:hypothetical protein